jgi:hypothetical protein
MLAYILMSEFFLMSYFLRHTPRSGRQTTSHPRSSCSKVTVRSATGGHLAPSCSSAWSAIRRSAPSRRTRHTRKSSIGNTTSFSRTMCISATKLRMSFGGENCSYPCLTQHRMSCSQRCHRMICSSDRRMGVEQLKNHSFFYGVDWENIRVIDSPFVPRLRSITDTSYFPTDELQEVPDEPSGADSTGTNKDLAFLGYVILLSCLEGHLLWCYFADERWYISYTFKRFNDNPTAF